jgi:hypothetical protein
MTGRTLDKRISAINQLHSPPIDPQFRAFARAVIVFGGEEPRPEAVEQLARWYAGGYRRGGWEAALNPRTGTGSDGPTSPQNDNLGA